MSLDSSSFYASPAAVEGVVGGDCMFEKDHGRIVRDDHVCVPAHTAVGRPTKIHTEDQTRPC